MIELISQRFKKTYYQKSGSGVPVFLLHGFGEDRQIWDIQRSFLEKTYQVITPDFPGTASSQLPDIPLTIELLADFVFEIIQQERLENVVLAGHSMGGYVALAFIQKYPSLVKGLSLVHSSCFADDDVKIENRKKSIKLIENDGKEAFLRAMIPNLYSNASKNKVADGIQKHLTNALNCSSKTLIAYYNAMIQRQDTSEVLKNASFPVQFIIGKEDNAVPLAMSLKMCHMPSISHVELLDDVGHTSMIECPELLNIMLDKYLKTVCS